MANALVTIKGIENGLLIELDENEVWLTVTETLAQEIDAKESFFKNSPVTVNLGSRPVGKGDMKGLIALLERRTLTLWAVVSSSNTSINSAHELDIKTNESNQLPFSDLLNPAHKADTKPNPLNALSKGLIIRRTLRSGQRVDIKGHVVIIGDVNPGAEVIATGDVVIWGKLRGTVHAGADGDTNVMICALEMSPIQLRIADYIVTSPKGIHQTEPEIAMIRDNQIIVESWR
ncbi:MAG: septum site-determining protein MinC [Phototrophicaceae bacterium]